MEQFKKRNDEGFTLLEALIGITIAAIVFTAFIQTVLSTNMYVRLQDYQTTAVQLAQLYMEETLEKSFNDITHDYIYFEDEQDPIPNGNTLISIRVDSIDDPDFGAVTTPVDYKKVTVTVSWEANAPHYVGSQSYSLVCYATPNSGSVLNN